MTNKPTPPTLADTTEICIPCYLERYAAEVEAWRQSALRRRALRPRPPSPNWRHGPA